MARVSSELEASTLLEQYKTNPPTVQFCPISKDYCNPRCVSYNAPHKYRPAADVNPDNWVVNEGYCDNVLLNAESLRELLTNVVQSTVGYS